jgi:hypothetical protein
MFKYFSFLMAFVLSVLLVGTAAAQQPQHADVNWQASYWNNMTLSGTAVLQRPEAQIDYNWGSGAPATGVNHDQFSARWTRYVDFAAATYRFSATADDGIRVWINNELIINDWSDHVARTTTVDKQLTAGHHLITVEYYDNGGDAVAKLSFAPVTTPAASWRGEYFNNKTLSGSPVLERDDAQINFIWGAGSPATTVNPDQFSVRWSRYVELPAGNYCFQTSADDGIRVLVSGTLVINDWSDHPSREVRGNRFLPRGYHLIVVEYYENSGDAVAIFDFGLCHPSILRNWRGEYFNNMNLSGDPDLIRGDDVLDFNWGASSPAPGYIGSDTFSARWTRTLYLNAGNYRFTVTADDGVRLWVNNHLLIDAWTVQAARTYSGDIYLPAGNVEVKMEYFEQTGHAVAQMSWNALSTGGTPPPSSGAIIVDNSSAGFTRGGASSSWRTVSTVGHGGSMLWTYNNDQRRDNYNWARWYPSLTAGRYEVFVFIPRNYATTRQAAYWISHRDGFTQRVVNQYSYSDQWVSLGTYTFQANNSDYVSLSDITGESYLSRMIGFDAVKWERR